VPDVNRQSSRHHIFLEKKRNYEHDSTVTEFLDTVRYDGCSGLVSDAVAQVSYKVTDLGTLHNGYFGCAMGLNNHGWTETQYGLLEPSGALVKGQVAINVAGLTINLGTLGGPNSWDNPFGGEINDQGEAIGYSETDVPDPNGEDICGFGTHLECRAFFLAKRPHECSPDAGRK